MARRVGYSIIPLEEGSRAKCRRWGVRVSLGHDSRTGKRLRPYEQVEGTETEAIRRAEQIRAEHGISGASAGGMTVEEYFVGMWWPWKKQRIRATTAQGYQSLLYDKIVPLFGEQKLDSLNAYYVEMRLNAIENVGRRVEVYKMLRNGLKQAVRWKLVANVVTDAIEIPKRFGREKPVIKSQDFRTYLDLVKGSPIEPAVIIGFSCGARRSEMVALDAEDFDFSYQTEFACGRFRICRSMHYINKEFVVQPPKSAASERDVILPRWAGERLQKILPKSGPIMVEQGHRIHPDRLGRLWRKTINVENERRKQEAEETEKAYEELAVIPFKNLRHSCGTMLVREAGLPISDVQQLLGHEDPATTAKMYVQKGDESIQRTASAMNAISL